MGSKWGTAYRPSTPKKIVQTIWYNLFWRIYIKSQRHLSCFHLIMSIERFSEVWVLWKGPLVTKGYVLFTWCSCNNMVDMKIKIWNISSLTSYTLWKNFRWGRESKESRTPLMGGGESAPETARLPGPIWMPPLPTKKEKHKDYFLYFTIQDDFLNENLKQNFL